MEASHIRVQSSNIDHNPSREKRVYRQEGAEKPVRKDFFENFTNSSL
jgi:hypothetical protein